MLSAAWLIPKLLAADGASISSAATQNADNEPMMPDTETYKPKYMTWWEEDFLSDRKVMRMLPQARHYYRALLQAALFCSTRPYLPNIEEELMLLADAISPEDWSTHRETVLRMFDACELNGVQLYSHKRLLEQWKIMQDQQKHWKEMGRRSAAKRSTTVQPRLSSGSTEQDVDLEQEQDVEKTTTTAAARRVVPSELKPKTAKPAAASVGEGVSPEREALAREHFKRLVESGDKWALSVQGDDAAFKRKGFVDHVLESEPKKSGKKCKCGRPEPCPKHRYVEVPNAVPHLDLDDDLGDDLTEAL
jgi:hypothetical protein